MCIKYSLAWAIAAFCFYGPTLLGQQWSLEPGIGLGLHVTSEFEDRQGGFGMHAGLVYHTTEKIALALEYQTYAAGSFWSGTNPQSSDETTDTFGATNITSGILMARGRFQFRPGSAEGFFLGLAAGYQTYRRRIDVNGVRWRSEGGWTTAPEFGYRLDRFSMSLRWFPPMEIAEFDEIDRSDGRRKVFLPVRYSLLSLHVTYRIPLSRKE